MPIMLSKKPLFLAFVLACFLTGCQNDIDPVMPPPVACFSFDAPNGFNEGDEIRFTDCSENAALLAWDFGDGTTASTPNPTHAYKAEGLYTVTLVAQNQIGCDTVYQTIDVVTLYQNYIKINGTKYPIENASALTSYCLDGFRCCLLLAGPGMAFAGDSLTGYGKGLKLVFDCNTPGFSTAGLNSWAFLGAGAEPQNLEGQLFTYSLNGSTLELDLSAGNLQIHYQGTVAKGPFQYSPTLIELEAFIRKTQDPRASFSYDDYRRLLAELSKDQYIVLPLNEMIHQYNDTKIIVGMRHDVDCHPFKALEMAKLEQSFGLRSTYYILATATYYGELSNTGVFRFECLNPIYKQIFDLGCEIGIHNDLIAVMVYFGLDPFTFNHQELDFYRSIGIPVNGTASHGSYIASATVKNFKMFSDFTDVYSFTYNNKTYPIGQHTLAEYGFDYEAYFIDYNRYFSESGGVWSLTGGLDEVISSLQTMEPGQRVQILTHPVWWGKTNR